MCPQILSLKNIPVSDQTGYILVRIKAFKMRKYSLRSYNNIRYFIISNRFCYIRKPVGILRRKISDPCSDKSFHSRSASETYTYVINKRPDIRSLSAMDPDAHMRNIYLQYFYIVYIYKYRLSFDLLPTPCQIIQFLPSYFLGRIHRGSLIVASDKFRNDISNIFLG